VCVAVPSRADQPSQVTPAADKQEDQTPKKHGLLAIMPDLSLYYPTASKTRDRFGNAWENIGVCLKLTGNNDARDQVGLHVSYIGKSSGDGHVRMVPVRLNYTHNLGSESKSSPYVGAGAAALFLSLKSDQERVDTDLRCLPSGSVFAGLKFGSASFAQVEYNFIPKTNGFDLSGVGVSIGVGF
jgi:hypothetical protein